MIVGESIKIVFRDNPAAFLMAKPKREGLRAEAALDGFTPCDDCCRARTDEPFGAFWRHDFSSSQQEEVSFSQGFASQSVRTSL